MSAAFFFFPATGGCRTSAATADFAFRAPSPPTMSQLSGSPRSSEAPVTAGAAATGSSRGVCRRASGTDSVARSIETSSSSIKAEKSSIEPKLDSSRFGPEAGPFTGVATAATEAGVAAAFGRVDFAAAAVAVGSGFAGSARESVSGSKPRPKSPVRSKESGCGEEARARSPSSGSSPATRISSENCQSSSSGSRCVCTLEVACHVGRARQLALDRLVDDRLDCLGLARGRVRQVEGVLATGATHARTRCRNSRIVELEARRTFLASHDQVAFPAPRATARGGSLSARDRATNISPFDFFGPHRAGLEPRPPTSPPHWIRANRTARLDSPPMTKGFHYRPRTPARRAGA